MNFSHKSSAVTEKLPTENVNYFILYDILSICTKNPLLDVSKYCLSHPLIDQAAAASTFRCITDMVLLYDRTGSKVCILLNNNLNPDDLKGITNML